MAAIDDSTIPSPSIASWFEDTSGGLPVQRRKRAKMLVNQWVRLRHHATPLKKPFRHTNMSGATDAQSCRAAGKEPGPQRVR